MELLKRATITLLYPSEFMDAFLCWSVAFTLLCAFEVSNGCGSHGVTSSCTFSQMRSGHCLQSLSVNRGGVSSQGRGFPAGFPKTSTLRALTLRRFSSIRLKASSLNRSPLLLGSQQVLELSSHSVCTSLFLCACHPPARSLSYRYVGVHHKGCHLSKRQEPAKLPLKEAFLLPPPELGSKAYSFNDRGLATLVAGALVINGVGWLHE